MINDSKNSAGLQRSDANRHFLEIAIVTGLSTALVYLSACWFYAHGSLLYYGDAQSHLNISRGIIDSRHPGYQQIGSVWLPVLHLICLPFVGNDFLWTTGLAGTVPVAACFVASVLFFYLAALEAYEARLPAAVTAACFALNPNLLYLSSIPMTEIVFFLGVSVQLLALLRFRRVQDPRLVLLAALASIWASLTRYDGWFLIPFFALGFYLVARSGQRVRMAVLFAVIATLAPMYWAAHNQWATGDALSFYRGPYSAKGIYERGLAAGQQRDPGDHHWTVAALYYFTAGRLCVGWPLALIGAAGIISAIWNRRYIPVLLLLLTPCFYIWGMYSSGNPIHVPNLWPFSYYNTRYGIALLPLCAFAAGAIACVIPARWRIFGAALPVLAVLPWLVHPSHESWICWKESEHNSASRRFWTTELAQFFRQNYQMGDGVLFAEGDVPGVFCRARIPLSETLNQGDGPEYLVNAYEPGLVRNCKWAVVLMGERDPLSRTIGAANAKELGYERVFEVQTKYDPVVRVYRRRW